MRLQLALNVTDIDEAVALYTKMFGTEPHKRRPGYANFAIDNPPLKLVLFETEGKHEHLNHIGVEILDNAEMPAVHSRLAETGLLGRVEEDITCCHATQSKLWTRAVSGLSWEWYRITDDNPEVEDALGKTCCLEDPCEAGCTG